MADHDLADHQRTSFTQEGKTRDVFRKREALDRVLDLFRSQLLDPAAD